MQTSRVVQGQQAPAQSRLPNMGYISPRGVSPEKSRSENLSQNPHGADRNMVLFGISRKLEGRETIFQRLSVPLAVFTETDLRLASILSKLDTATLH